MPEENRRKPKQRRKHQLHIIKSRKKTQTNARKFRFTSAYQDQFQVGRDREGIVVDAVDRFVAQGGRWTPSRTLQRRIDAAALDQVKCPRL